MKHTLPVLLLAFCVLFSCKKDEHNNPPPTPGVTKYPVQFKVLDFKHDLVDLRWNPAAKDDSLANKINWLYYIVYDSAGNWLHYDMQTTVWQPNNFGLFRDSLTPGNYTIIVAGSKSALEINDHYDGDFETFVPLPLASTFIYFYSGLSEQLNIFDFFTKTIAINVPPDSLQVEVTLERKVGLLEINIPDAPTDPQFVISPLSEGDYFYPYGDTARIIHRPFDLLYPNYAPLSYATRISPTKWQLLTLNTERPFDILLNTYYGSNSVDRYKIVRNVRCYKNRKTILTGNFYDDSQSVDVGVNDQWDSTNIEIPF